MVCNYHEEESSVNASEESLLNGQHVQQHVQQQQHMQPHVQPHKGAGASTSTSRTSFDDALQAGTSIFCDPSYDSESETEEEITTVLNAYERIPQEPPCTDSDIKQLLDLDMQLSEIMRALAFGNNVDAVPAAMLQTDTTSHDMKHKYTQLNHELAAEIDANIKIYQAYYRLALRYRKLKSDRSRDVSDPMVTTLQQDVARLQNVCKDQEVQLAGQAGDIDGLVRDNQKLLGILKEEEEKLSQLEEKIALKEKQMTELIEKNNVLEKQNIEKDAEILQLKQKVADFEINEEKRISQKNDDYISTVNGLRNQLDFSGREIAGMHTENARLRTENAELCAKLEIQQNVATSMAQEYASKEKHLLMEMQAMQAMQAMYATQDAPVQLLSRSSSSMSRNADRQEELEFAADSPVRRSDGFQQVVTRTINSSHESVKSGTSLSKSNSGKFGRNVIEPILENKVTTGLRTGVRRGSRVSEDGSGEMRRVRNFASGMPDYRRPSVETVHSAGAFNMHPAENGMSVTLFDQPLESEEYQVIPLKSTFDLGPEAPLSSDMGPDGSPRWVSKPRIDVKTHFFKNQHRRAKSLITQSTFNNTHNKLIKSGSVAASLNSTSKYGDGEMSDGLYKRKFHSVNNIKKYGVG